MRDLSSAKASAASKLNIGLEEGTTRNWRGRIGDIHVEIGEIITY